MSEAILIRRGEARFSRLPSGYTEVEYISATTTQWINCNFSSSNTKIEIKMSDLDMATSGSYAYMFGQYVSSKYFATMLTSNNKTVGYAHVSARTTLITLTDTTEQHVYVMDDVGVTVDGVSKVTYSGNAAVAAFGLFAAMSSTSAAYNRARLKAMTCYYCKLWNGSTLTRDFVPCIRDSDAAVGMYDLVSETFFENSGSGSFTAGPIV